MFLRSRNTQNTEIASSGIEFAFRFSNTLRHIMKKGILSMRDDQFLNSRRPFVERSFEEKICDERDLCSPAEFIQRKLQSVLPERQIPVSALRMERLVRR